MFPPPPPVYLYIMAKVTYIGRVLNKNFFPIFLNFFFIFLRYGGGGGFVPPPTAVILKNNDKRNLYRAFDNCAFGGGGLRNLPSADAEAAKRARKTKENQTESRKAFKNKSGAYPAGVYQTARADLRRRPPQTRQAQFRGRLRAVQQY